MLGKVKFHGNGGYDCEKQDALAILTVGKEYEVEWVDVGGWYSTYKLVGYDKQYKHHSFHRRYV